VSPHRALDPERLDAPTGWVVEIVETAPSTNAVVAERARAGAGEGLVLVAEHQTSGRGRLDRTWETPARAALTFSVLLRPRSPAVDWPWFPLLTGYAVSLALRRTGAVVGLKWPNDVLLGDHKLAGILTERVEAPSGPALVVGIGVNVGMTREELPVETATSLAAAGYDVDRTALLNDVLGSLGGQYAAFERGATAALRSAYVGACVTLGRPVEVSLPSGEVVTGEATGVDEGGRLLVATSTGTVPVSAGDVVHARLA
jgi:BirA family biotin operon repressor/biotin-[acetyl-CoA-carboxylase] ligase